ncbi:hypothetical protein ACOSP7_023046 [Xanthoceras sorbifolium]
MEYRSLRGDSLSSRHGPVEGARIYLKKELASSAQKLRDSKEMISSLMRENDYLNLSKARAKMAERESATLDEDLSRRVAKLEANVEQLQKDRKVKVDSLAGQIKELVEKFETIAGDAVVKTKAELMAECKVGKVNHWCPDKGIAVWDELKALATAEAGEVEPSVEDGMLVPTSANDAQGK